MPRRKPHRHEALGLSWRTGVVLPERLRSWIEGRVAASARGAKPTDCTLVLVEAESGLAQQIATLSEQGKFRFEIPPGDYRLVLEAPFVNGCGDSTTIFRC